MGFRAPDLESGGHVSKRVRKLPTPIGHEEPPGMAPSCRNCEKTSTTPQASAIRPPAKRKMKISLYVTDLPVGGRPMYSPWWVPVTEFLLTTLSPSAIKSSTVM